MEPPQKPPPTSLFQVYLRLRPPPSPLVQLTQQSLYPLLPGPERYLTVESTYNDSPDGKPTHITIHPPSESRKRAVEKFAFTKVFEEEASQLDIFRETGVVSLVEGVLGEGRDGLVATLGVTGSGKSHTILGSKSQRGITQLSVDLLFRSLGKQILHPTTSPSLVLSLSAADSSEGQILSASSFLDGMFGDVTQSQRSSRAPTPMMVCRISTSPKIPPASTGLYGQWSILSLDAGSSPIEEKSNAESLIALPSQTIDQGERSLPSKSFIWNTPRITRKQAKLRFGNTLQDPHFVPSVPKRNLPQRPSVLPSFPDISDLSVSTNPNTEYTILVSMYEVYNDRIFDLLSKSQNLKDLRRRPLLFKSTEASPDRKVVAGLRKVVCGSYEEALVVLEIGLVQRRVAGTGSNSVSSRSHGFFCVEVKRRAKGGMASLWSGAQLTIVDLAGEMQREEIQSLSECALTKNEIGSERARNAKTAGATLVEAGKINESLMYLGQCLQMQSDCQEGSKPSIVPFRQCKLTELLFSNSFPSSSHHPSHHAVHHRNAQKAIMIVTADPLGDFNATSQILRYSALAREVTVPRIPSVSSTILSSISASHKPQIQTTSGRTSPNETEDTDKGAILEMAFSEIARLSEEVEILTIRLSEEEGRRREAEEEWQKAEEKAEAIETAVREECWGDMEGKLAEERRRWMGAWGEEADRNDEHLDRKLEILSQGIQIHEDAPQSPSQYTEDLELENEALRRKLESLERELQSQSPTRSARKSPLSLRVGQDDFSPIISRFDTMHLKENDSSRMGMGSLSKEMRTPSKGEVKIPGRKVRKLTAKKWDLMDENEMDTYGEYY